MLRNSTTGFVFCVYLTYSSPSANDALSFLLPSGRHADSGGTGYVFPASAKKGGTIGNDIWLYPCQQPGPE